MNMQLKQMLDSVPLPPKKLMVAVIALLECIEITAAADAAAHSHPNVLFILADDLGYMDVGANNPNTFYETPNIDALAKKGMRFTSGYAACPVCSPTRASILTGKYPQRTGITDYIGGPQPGPWNHRTKLLPAPYQEYLSLSETTLAKAFKAQGYTTFFAGKWHLGPEGYWPENQGFDVNVAGCGWGHPKTYFSPYGNPKLADGPEGENLPHRLAAETVKFIESNRDKPFLAYLSFYSVHTPLEARDDLVKKYAAKAKSLKVRGPEFGLEGKSKVRLMQNHPVYAGMIEAMDSAIGEVLAALDRLQLANNTIVVFTSDNGGLSTAEGQPTSNLPLRGGKGWLYEGGIREPLIFYVPAAKAENDEKFPRVAKTTYTSGKNTKQQEEAKGFLVSIGVREVGEREHVEAVLKERYVKTNCKPNFEDLPRWVALVEKDKENADLFRNYFIFQRDDDKWGMPHQVFMDHPFLQTGLSLYYNSLPKPNGVADPALPRSLSTVYEKCGVTASRLVAFAKAVGVKTRLESINDLSKILPHIRDGIQAGKPDMPAIGYVWQTLCEYGKNNSHILEDSSSYHKGWGHYGTVYISSHLCYELRRLAWIPQQTPSGVNYCQKKESGEAGFLDGELPHNFFPRFVASFAIAPPIPLLLAPDTKLFLNCRLQKLSGF